MKYTVIKNKIIHATKSELLKNVANFHKWYNWSPWACLDPNTRSEVKPGYLSWSSKFSGSGYMQLTKQDDTQLNIDLFFIRPFNSQAKITFTFEELTNNSTQITWQMVGTLPFYLFFLKKLFQVMIGRDFERGLTRLQYLAETDKVPVKLEFVDTPQHIEGFTTSGISSSCSMSNITQSIHATFDKLNELTSINKLDVDKFACFCDKVRLTQEKMDYTASVIHKDKEKAIQGLSTRKIPQHKAIKVILYGRYDFISDAWAGIYAHLHGLKLKANKKIPPYEIYVEGPHNNSNPENYITEIYMPIKE